MLKIRKLKLSGFRGILNPQELDLTVQGDKSPRPFVLFGLNSSGKTSFVDGLEWFLSKDNKIEWLRREEAEEKAYPHQAARDKSVDSFVNVEFYDTANRIGTLTKTFDQQLKQLIEGLTVVTEVNVLSFCNELLKLHEIAKCESIDEVWDKIPEINKLKSASSVGVAVDKLTRAEATLAALVLKDNLADQAKQLEEKIEIFRKEKKLVEQIDVIELYTHALGILTRQTTTDTKCPVCGKDWEREKLIAHIKGELELLKKTKEDKEELERDSLLLKGAVDRETLSVKELNAHYEEIQSIISEIQYDAAKNYLKCLNDLTSVLGSPMFDEESKIKLHKEDFD